MAKEILIYGGINAYSAERFIDAVNALPEGSDLILRINTNGGSPEDMTGMIAKFKEFKGNKKIIVDGKAYSSGAYFLLYADAENIEMSDTSKIMIHRAAYPSWIEGSKEHMTEERKSILKGVNDNLRSALEARISTDDFKSVTKVGFDEIFSMDSRVDVFLDAKQAKKLGLVSKVNVLTPKRKKQIDAEYISIAAEYNGIKTQDVVGINPAVSPVLAGSQKLNVKKKMTKEEFKEQDSKAYGEIVAEGEAKEKDRAAAWNVWASVDAKKVLAGIESGLPMGMKDTQEFLLASNSSKEVSGIEGVNAEPVQTTKVETELEAEAAEEAKTAEFMKNLKID